MKINGEFFLSVLYRKTNPLCVCDRSATKEVHQLITVTLRAEETFDPALEKLLLTQCRTFNWYLFVSAATSFVCVHLM